MSSQAAGAEVAGPMPCPTPRSGKIPLGLSGSAPRGTTTPGPATTASRHWSRLGAGRHKQFGSVTEQEEELPLGFALQSGPDSYHVFVRIRNDGSLESKQLRRAITITRHILLPCLLSCLISQLHAFLGKAHMGFLTRSF